MGTWHPTATLSYDLRQLSAEQSLHNDLAGSGQRLKNDRALVMQASRVSASLKHGITMVSSTDMKPSHETQRSVSPKRGYEAPPVDAGCLAPLPDQPVAARGIILSPITSSTSSAGSDIRTETSRVKIRKLIITNQYLP